MQKELSPLSFHLTAYGLAALTFIGVIVVGRIFVALKPIRRIIAPEARLEGVWLQTITRAARPRSVVVVKFDWLRYAWSYEGWALPDAAGDQAPAEWRSETLFHRDGKFYFDAEAVVRQDNAQDPMRRAQCCRRAQGGLPSEGCGACRQRGRFSTSQRRGGV